MHLLPSWLKSCSVMITELSIPAVDHGRPTTLFHESPHLAEELDDGPDIWQTIDRPGGQPEVVDLETTVLLQGWAEQQRKHLCSAWTWLHTVVIIFCCIISDTQQEHVRRQSENDLPIFVGIIIGYDSVTMLFEQSLKAWSCSLGGYL